MQNLARKEPFAYQLSLDDCDSRDGSNLVKICPYGLFRMCALFHHILIAHALFGLLKRTL